MTQQQPAVCRAIDSLNEHLGRVVAWTGLIMVLIQFLVVILRYVFAIGWIPLQESILYMHGILFLLGAGFTLKADGHVRVDIFYREASARKKAAIDMFGVLGLLLPVCAVIWWYGWSFIYNSWTQLAPTGRHLKLEGSQEPLGLHLVFMMKTFILIFATVVALQGIALLIRSFLVIAGRLDTNMAPVPDNERREPI